MKDNEQGKNSLNKKMHIVHLVGKLGAGGIESLLISMCKVMDSEEVETSLFMWDQGESDLYDADYLKSIGINTVYRLVHKDNRIVRFIWKLRELYSYIKEENNNIDILHIHGSNVLVYFMGAVAKKAGMRKVILHIHTSFAFRDKPISYIEFLMVKPFFEHYADFVIACSYNSGKCVIPRNHKKFMVVQNGIDVERFRFNQDKRDLFREKMEYRNSFVVGHVGRFSKVKNHNMILKVFDQIHKIIPDSKLLLIGTGSDKNKIEKKIAEMRLDNYVDIMEPIKNVEEAMMGMDAMIFPSFWEGLPLVPLEAQACSLPVYVSSTITKEVNVSRYINYIDLKESPSNWADKIISTTRKYNRENDADTIQESGLDIKNTADKLLTIYKSVLD